MGFAGAEPVQELQLRIRSACWYCNTREHGGLTTSLHPFPSFPAGFMRAQLTKKNLRRSLEIKKVAMTVQIVRLNDFYFQFHLCAFLWKQSILG